MWPEPVRYTHDDGRRLNATFLHIEVSGNGPALVLVHGWALHGGIFDPLVKRLSSRYTLYRVDLPGHGHSREARVPLELEACARLIASATPPAVWLGWSLGGLVALHAAATLVQVHALAMVAATPRFVRDVDWPYGVDEQVFARFGQELELNYRGTLERFLALDTLGSEHARSELRTLRETLVARGEPAPRALQEGLRLLQDSDLRDALPQLGKPSLWIAGHRDRLVSPSGMRVAAESVADGRFLDIAGGGHAPFLGHADMVAGVLDAFAAETFATIPA